MTKWGDHESPFSSDLMSRAKGDVQTTGRAPLPLRDFDFFSLVAIADTLPVMVAYCDPEQRYLFVNKPIAEWFGKPRGEILGKRISEVMPQEAYGVRRDAIELALGGETQVFCSEYDHPEQGRLYTKATYRPHLDREGDVVGLVMIVEDITEQRRSERALLDKVEAGSAALADRDARLEAIFDSVESVIVLMKPDGTVLESNDRKAPWRPTGGEGEAGLFVWETPTAKAYPEGGEDLRSLVARAAAGETIIDERELMGEGRSPAALQTTLRPIYDEAGTVCYLLMEARDLTDLRHAQDQLRQAQKMEALGQLTGGIAHDFNNLLTVVVGGLDMIARRDVDEKTRAYVHNALAAAERGARLTGQLLAFSRVQKLEVRPSDIAQLIHEVRPLLRNVLGPGIDKSFDLAPDVGPAMADPTQLEVALLNLAVNARDAMPDGGCLAFSLREVEVADDDPELAPGTYVELAVSDTGTGMEEEVRARVFEPFYTTKEVGKGTGLGLSMVYGMARQSGGTARITSTPGEGTRVALLLRRADQHVDHAERPAPIGPAKPSTGGHSVLVVDDDEAVRTFIAETLREHGYQVCEAASGREGLVTFEEARPDMVILDYIMPGLSGADVARAMVGQVPDLPILFVSGYSETEAIRAVAPGAGFLAKPFRAETLLDALEKLVDA